MDAARATALQEAEMFDTFAAEVEAARLNRDIANTMPSFWAYVSAATQAACEAVLRSDAEEGARVEVARLQRFEPPTQEIEMVEIREMKEIRA